MEITITINTCIYIYIYYTCVYVFIQIIYHDYVLIYSHGRLVMRSHDEGLPQMQFDEVKGPSLVVNVAVPSLQAYARSCPSCLAKVQDETFLGSAHLCQSYCRVKLGFLVMCEFVSSKSRAAWGLRSFGPC